jgi:hypothetical protein
MHDKADEGQYHDCGECDRDHVSPSSEGPCRQNHMLIEDNCRNQGRVANQFNLCVDLNGAVEIPKQAKDACVGHQPAKAFST